MTVKTTQKLSLAYRAAQYVGKENTPRTSIDLGNDKVLVVFGGSKTRFALLYSEEFGRPHGTTFTLTERRVERIIDALEGWL